MKAIVITDKFVDRIYRYYRIDLGLPTKDAVVTALLKAHWKADGPCMFAHVPPQSGSACLFVATNEFGKIVSLETFCADVIVQEHPDGYILNAHGDKYRIGADLYARRIFD